MTRTGSDNAEKVVYHDRKVTTEEFFVITNPGMVQKWKTDKTIPLVEVVQSFDIFQHGTGGHEGVATRPSKQTLLDVFGTKNETEVVEWLLLHGTVQRAVSNKDTGSPKEFYTMMPGKGRSVSNRQQPGVHG
ncbi:ribosome maturation protein [Paraphysoderma sedebokerense]|nr:ribosome maturation protein [Paraphysoderma sedebokerense]KAI9143568.1 ribosome maturation protein [Paraphysoderma sedebokerense]